MSLSSTSIPKPKNWQDFESNTRVLMKCVLNDPMVMQNGRPGQGQSGVDVFGCRNQDVSKLVGVQCKKKLDSNVTERELRAEVTKARKFQPKLSEFILVTTAPRDQAIQTVARIVTEELAKTPDPMLVFVWGWDDIEDHASKFDEAWKAFDPSYTPFVENGFEKLEVSQRQGFDQLLKEFKEIKAAALQPIAITADAGSENTPLHGRITAFIDLIEDGHVELALTQLEKVRKNDWASASRSERYRILVAIASAKIKEDYYPEAGALLLDAFAECPDHKKAKQNRSKGYLLTGNGEKAAEVALEILKADPQNADAAGTLIQARVRDSKCKNPLEDVPSELLETEDVLIAHVHFLRCREDRAWISLVRTVSKKAPNSQHLKVMAAEALLEQLVESDRGVLVGAPVTVVSQEELSDAVAVLKREALDAVENSYRISPSLANNAALALRFVDDIPTAIKILDSAVAQHPDDHNLSHMRAILAFSQGDMRKVLELVPENASNPEAIPIRATALADTGRPDDAINLIDSFDPGAAPEHVKMGLVSARCHAYLVRGDKDLAVETVRRAVLNAPEDLPMAAVLIRTLYLAVDGDTASKALDEALKHVDDKTPMSSRLLLSFEAERLARNDAIVDLLKGRVETTHDNEALRLLIPAAINGQFWVTARDTLDAASAALQEEEWMQRARTILSINTGDRAADQKVGGYLTKWPDDAQMILARIGTWQRIGRDKDIDAFVKTLNYDTLRGPPAARIRIAAVACHHGDAERALKYAYSVLMDNWDNAKAHLVYHGSILLNEEITPFLPSSDVVDENTVVYLVSEDGSAHTYRLEKRSYKFFADERIDVGSDLGLILTGKRLGEKFFLSEHTGAKPVTIKAIKSIYLDALHRSLDQFNERFPRTNGLVKLSFDVTADDPLEDMRTITKDRAESDNWLLEQYKTSLVPLCFVAGIMGRDPLDAWAGLPSVQVQFQVSRGINQERDEALTLIRRRERKGCVIDAVTLTIIRRLKILDAVIGVCGPVHTPQTVFDLLARRALEAKSNVGRKMGFLSWRDGQLVMQEYTEEMLQRAADDSEVERAWALASITPVIAMPAQELPAEIRAIVDTVGRLACDPAIAANGSGLLLLSDDMGLRVWASDTLKVGATWIQPVLMLARHEGRMTEEQYCEAINTLAQSGHTYTSLEPGTLIHQARKTGFDLTQELRQLLDAIGGVSADLPRNCWVAANFLNLVLRECADDVKITRIVNQVFASMAKGRIGDQRTIVAWIIRGVKVRQNWFVDHALGWLVGHSIGAPDFQELLQLQKDTMAWRRN